MKQVYTEVRERQGRRCVKPLCGSFATLRPWRVTRLHPKACDSMRSLVGEQACHDRKQASGHDWPGGIRKVFFRW